MKAEILPRRSRYLCLWAPRWPTDRFRRSTPSPEAGARPLVLFERAGGALRLYAVDNKAAALGLYCGQALADARAIAPNLIVEKADPVADSEAFLKLCEWHMRYSPFVAPYAASDIVIDIGGCAHLFGGEQKLLDEALSRLADSGLEAQGAIADTIGAAWAGAHSQRRLIVPPEKQKEALLDLPVAALRLEEDAASNLNRLGLKRIRQLCDMPRAPLAARFGERLNERLDQALGLAPEPMTPLTSPPDYSATRKLAEPVSTEASILYCLGPLAGELQEMLAKDGVGGRRFELTLYRVDNALLRLEVRTSAPTRTADHVVRLIKNKLQDYRDDFDAGFGFEAIRLAARDCDPADAAQAEAFADTPADETDAALIDRLSNRLGARHVVRLACVDSHLPERAVAYAPALAPSKAGAPPAPGLRLNRPLRLLPRPEEIDVMAEIPDGPPLRFKWRRVIYRAARAGPPERIADEWWRREAPRQTRDYYRVETSEGWRFWVFRTGLYGEGEAAPRWFLHGFFA